MAYSLDYKRRAVGYKDEGHTFKDLEEVFKITHKTYYTWKKKLEEGYFDKKRVFERKRKIDKEKLLEVIEEKPDAYLSELAELFNCSSVAIFKALKKLNITYKKRRLHIQKSLKKNGWNIQ